MMLHKPELSDQQGVRDIVTEGVTKLTAVEMHRVLDNCGYEHQRAVSERHMLVLADLMIRGRWQPKSQIDFAVLDGRYILINGYHRGYAQVRSGKPVVWNIALHKVASEAELRALYYSGGVVAVAVATMRYQSDTAWQFWSGVASNDGLKRGDPRLALFNDFLVRDVRGGAATGFAPSIIAWNAFFGERELRIIKVTDNFAPIIDGTPFDGKPAKVA